MLRGALAGLRDGAAGRDAAEVAASRDSSAKSKKSIFRSLDAPVARVAATMDLHVKARLCDDVRSELIDCGAAECPAHDITPHRATRSILCKRSFSFLTIRHPSRSVSTSITFKAKPPRPRYAGGRTRSA